LLVMIEGKGLTNSERPAGLLVTLSEDEE